MITELLRLFYDPYGLRQYSLDTKRQQKAEGLLPSTFAPMEVQLAKLVELLVLKRNAENAEMYMVYHKAITILRKPTGMGVYSGMKKSLTTMFFRLVRKPK